MVTKSRYVASVEERRKRNAPTKPRKLLPPEKLPLTPKQHKFVMEYVMADGMRTITDCAIAAGYSKHSAPRIGSGLLRKPHVRKAVNAQIALRDEKYGIKYERHLRSLAQIRDKALDPENLNLSAAVQAEYRRGQVGGLYINRTEVRHGSIDAMSKEDVLRALNELRGNVINGTAEVVEEEVGEPVLETDKKPVEKAASAA
jgi:hypothetical protein|tara:strand:+ start:314 stop:916 length:603 start_codon:yes stop_codon:yes gene_type:complete